MCTCHQQNCETLPNYAYYLSTHIQEQIKRPEDWETSSAKQEVMELLNEMKALIRHCPSETSIRCFEFIKRSMFSIEVEDWLYIVSLLIEEVKSDMQGIW